MSNYRVSSFAADVIAVVAMTLAFSVTISILVTTIRWSLQ